MDIREYLSNAEGAFANGQYETALEWYRKVLELNPDNVHVLSRIGSISVALDHFETALTSFKRVIEIEPQNGDAHYNYGNANFLNKDFVVAFSSYVRAAKYGCSDEILPKLYYQMALLCSVREDVDNALIYIRKCEEADKTGVLSLNPDLISEKLKLYSYQQDFKKAMEAAEQLVAIEPNNFRYYMVYFSLLISKNDYAAAEKLLTECKTYSKMDADERAALAIQYAMLYTTMGQADEENRIELLQKATVILEHQLRDNEMGEEATQNLQFTLADILQKSGEYDKAIRLMQTLLTGRAYVEEADVGAVVPELTEEELAEMLGADVYKAYELVVSGELDPDIGAYVPKTYDDYGNEIPLYSGHEFDAMGNIPVEPAEPAELPAPEPAPELSAEVREKAQFVLMTCYLEKDAFEVCKKLAEALKESENKYYAYYGRYVLALIQRKLEGATSKVERTYAETLAFFRSRCFADPSDTMAVIFRARLYAEQGSYAKAEELANLLAGYDRESLLSYVEACRQDA